ncbi:uncharacterized protein LOC111398106 [Olea europaea var. sylvestris]|uniref:uncharacterized protein LOC111398106 n=1 Tax=Olea europaea var. sylvestris TaxID=158386 RepID=UPI000C1D5A27|nr:uncharacterized protein LOC111398106 [Olea europaea var. sylvestris]
MRKYDTYGLPLAVQIWVYETVPEARGLVRDLGVPHTPDEEMPDPSLDRDWVSDRRSPPPGPSPPPLASSPPRVSSPPLASPPSRASPSLVASPPPGPSPPPLASPPSRHLPCVSPGHSDDLYAHLTGFIAEEVGALRRDLTERVDDLGRELTGRVNDLAGKGVAPMGMGEGTTEGVAPTGGAEEVATGGGGLGGRGGGGGDGGGGPYGGGGGGGPRGREDARRD